MLHEKLGRLIQQRAARHIGASGDAHQPTFQQALHHTVHGHTAHRLDVRARDRLPVGNDGERLQRGAAKSGWLAFRVKLADPDGKIRLGHDRPAADLLHELKGAVLVLVFKAELIQKRHHLGFLELGKHAHRLLVGVVQRRAQRVDDFSDGKRLLGGEDERFDDFFEEHGIR